MTRSSVLKFFAVVALIYALLFLLLPELFLSWIGITLPVAGILVGHAFGALLLVVAGTTWGASNAADSDFLKLFLGSSLVGHLVGLAFLFQAQISGVANTLGWTSVVVYLVLVAGYAGITLGWIKDQ